MGLDAAINIDPHVKREKKTGLVYIDSFKLHWYNFTTTTTVTTTIATKIKWIF